MVCVFHAVQGAHVLRESGKPVPTATAGVVLVSWICRMSFMVVVRGIITGWRAGWGVSFCFANNSQGAGRNGKAMYSACVWKARKR